MKIKYKYLRLNESKELEKLLCYGNKRLIRNILRYINNDLSTKQVEKFISLKSFEKRFYDDYYECIVKFSFSPFGDMTLEVMRFGKRDMYKEIEHQQKVQNFEGVIIVDDNHIF